MSLWELYHSPKIQLIRQRSQIINLGIGIYAPDSVKVAVSSKNEKNNNTRKKFCSGIIIATLFLETVVFNALSFKGAREPQLC